MTKTEAYVFLGQVRCCDNKIRRLERTIESLRSTLLPGAIRYDKDRVDTSPQDNMTEIYAKIDEYERQLAEETQKRTNAILKVDDALSKMKDCKEQRVLQEHYIGKISLMDIASGMGITYRHCVRLRDNGVSMFAEVMTND